MRNVMHKCTKSGALEKGRLAVEWYKNVAGYMEHGIPTLILGSTIRKGVRLANFFYC